MTRLGRGAPRRSGGPRRWRRRRRGAECRGGANGGGVVLGLVLVRRGRVAGDVRDDGAAHGRLGRRPSRRSGAPPGCVEATTG